MIILGSKLLKTSLSRKLDLAQSRLVSNGFLRLLFICSRFSCKVSANLVVIDSKSCQTLFPSFSSPLSGVAVLFTRNMSRHLFLGRVAYFDLLLSVLCTGLNSGLAGLF